MEKELIKFLFEILFENTLNISKCEQQLLLFVVLEFPSFICYYTIVARHYVRENNKIQKWILKKSSKLCEICYK